MCAKEQQTTKDRIVDAALRVVNKVGFSKATIDEIITETPISKGGFLYHFPTKNECLLALIDRTFARILAGTYRIAEDLPDSPGKMLRAYVLSWLEWQEPPHSIQIIGLTEDPVLRDRLIDHRIRHYELVLDGQIPELTTQTVLLICNGLWTIPLLARATPEELSAFRGAMRAEMMRIIDQAVAGIHQNGGTA